MKQRIQLQVIAKVSETARTATLVLQPVNGPLAYQAGQFLTFLFDDLGGREIRRSYSLSSTPGVDKQLSVTVTKIANGAVSRHLVDVVQPGEVLTALPPAGRFVLDEAGEVQRDVFLIGGGSGITPLFSLLKYVLHFEPQSRVVLIDANRDEDHIIFREQLSALARAYPHTLTILHYLSRPKETLAALRPAMAPATLRWGHLSNSLVEELVRQYGHYAPDRARFFLCGPAGLLIKAENVLGFMGFDAAQVKREVFTIKSPYRPTPERFPLSQVQVRWNDREYLFPVLPGQPILEAALHAGIDLPYSCRSGSCTTCTAQCRSGKVEMYTQEGRHTSDETGGLVLTCVGYPLTSHLKLEI